MKKIALIIILSISLTNLAVSHAAITNPELKTSVVQIWSQEEETEAIGLPQGYAVFFSNFGMSLEEFETIIEQPDFETGLNFDNFTNSHGLNGLKLIEGAEKILSNLFLFENREDDAAVEILYLPEEENINDAMDLIRDTFRFYQ